MSINGYKAIRNGITTIIKVRNYISRKSKITTAGYNIREVIVLPLKPNAIRIRFIVLPPGREGIRL